MLHFIYNPIAGKGKSQRLRTALEKKLKALGVAYRFYETLGRRHACDIAHELTHNPALEQDIVAMGGDGTLHEVLDGLVDAAKVRLGIIPCGSGNDFAAVANIPGDPDGVLKLLTEGEARPTDYMECSGVRGLNAIGTGIDVDILRRYNNTRLIKGSAAYLYSLVSTLFTFKSKRFTERGQNGEKQHNAMIACAGNGQRFGGGIFIAPEAVIDDGLMDVVIVDDIKRAAIPGAFIKLMHREILSLPTTDFKRVAHLSIQSNEPMPIQIDGEIYENLPFDVQIVHNKLRIFRP